MKAKYCILLLLMLLPVLLFGAKRQLVWVIDAGHGGHDQGTKGKNITEKTINLKVSQEVVRLIKKHKPGIRVVQTRKNDKFVSLQERCRIANRAGADLFLSIHVNWARKRNLRGTETFYAARNVKNQARHAAKSELLARLLQNNYAASGRPIYRGVRTNRMYVTANTQCPAALTEIAFISNKNDEAYITTEKGMKETAYMIFNALMEYYTATQGGTVTKTLGTLRSTNDKKSGVKNSIRVPVKYSGKSDPEPVVEEVAEEEQKPAAVEKKKSVEKKQAKPTDEKQAEKQKSAAEKKEPATTKKTAVSKASAKPVFSIQIITSPKKLKQTDKRLKGVGPVSFVKDGNVFKGLYGGTTDYKKIKQQLKTIRNKFPQAFVVAYLGDKPITTAEALEIIKEKK